MRRGGRALSVRPIEPGRATRRGRPASSGPSVRRHPHRSLVKQLRVQRAQFGAWVRAETGGEYGAYLLVRRQRLRRTSGVPQRPQAQCLERFVYRVVGAERDQFRQDLVGAAQRQRRGEPGAAGIQSAGRPAGGDGPAVGQIGEDRAPPQGERIVEDRDGLGGIARVQGPHPSP